MLQALYNSRSIHSTSIGLARCGSRAASRTCGDAGEWQPAGATHLFHTEPLCSPICNLLVDVFHVAQERRARHSVPGFVFANRVMGSRLRTELKMQNFKLSIMYYVRKLKIQNIDVLRDNISGSLAQVDLVVLVLGERRRAGDETSVPLPTREPSVTADASRTSERHQSDFGLVRVGHSCSWSCSSWEPWR